VLVALNGAPLPREPTGTLYVLSLKYFSYLVVATRVDIDAKRADGFFSVFQVNVPRERCFWIVLLGAALIAPSFVQAAGSANAPTLTSTTVTVRWNKSPSRDVKGYRLHCGLTSGRYYARLVNVGNVTSYTFSNLIPGKTYYCVVTAYNAAGKESPPSNEISFTASKSPRNSTPATQH